MEYGLIRDELDNIASIVTENWNKNNIDYSDYESAMDSINFILHEIELQF